MPLVTIRAAVGNIFLRFLGGESAGLTAKSAKFATANPSCGGLANILMVRVRRGQGASRAAEILLLLQRTARC
jgi:hypothetical protein